MPRGKSAAAATPVSKQGHKRQLSSDKPIAENPATRASKRLRESTENTPTSATPKKSKYFDDSEIEDEVKEDDPSSADAEESGYDDEDASVTDAEPSEDDDEDDYDSEEDNRRARPKTKKQPGGIGGAIVSAGKHLWREGVKTGLGPGKQVFIEKPKPRADGGIKYMSDRIHPNTMLFLADLKKNNDREWLKMHDPDYRQSWKDWESFVDAISEKISEVDETVPELPPKDLVFRVCRDVRFSPDPTPYKAHFSAAWSRTGRKGPFAAYYVQISPHGQSFVGSGLWMPEAQPLALLRRDIDRHPERLRSILTDANLRKLVLNGISKDEKKAIKAFTDQNKENMLKTKPKGYEADHPNIELLRLRNFTVGKRLSEDEVLGPKSLPRIMEIVTAMVPFVTYLNGVVMPDDDDDDDDDDNENSEADNDESERSDNNDADESASD